MGIILPTGQRAKEARENQIKLSEDEAAAEFKEFLDAFQKKHDVQVFPFNIIGVHGAKGIAPISSQFDILSNKRFKK